MERESTVNQAVCLEVRACSSRVWRFVALQQGCACFATFESSAEREEKGMCLSSLLGQVWSILDTILIGSRTTLEARQTFLRPSASIKN